jgi:hypothetical protein
MTDLRDLDKEFGAAQPGQLDIRKLEHKDKKVATRRSANTHAVKKAIREETKS